MFKGMRDYLARRKARRRADRKNAPKGHRAARFDMDRKLERYLTKADGFYVELGAFDGIGASNTYFLEKTKGWRGILVEPCPNLFLKCLRARGARNRVFCNACVSLDYKDRFVEMVYSGSMSLGLGLDADVPDASEHAALGEKHLRDGEVLFTFGAVARPLTDLLREGGAPSAIDFLSLDVEGAELEVLRGIDFSAYRIEHILVECRDVDRMRRFLEPLGYGPPDAMSHHDYLFRLER